MSQVLSFFFSYRFLSLIGLGAISSIIWVVGPLLSIGTARPLETTTGRLILIGVIVLLFLLRWAWKSWKARKTNDAVVQQLLAQAPKEAVAAQGDAAADELKIIRERFEQALRTLKAARFERKGGWWSTMSARMGKRYLYELPWYVIIGAPGSGKTTALLNSGLKFPLADQMGEASVRGVGGTRNCDWWFTNEAVLVDTAGRYTTQDSDREVDQKAWGGFLSLLKKSRPRQPVNGVLVTVSVTDLLTRSAAERAAQASAIRARVQELHQHLGIRFPIYLLVTKCDLLSGFMDYFADADKAVRDDPWGFTFKLDERQTSDLAAFDTEFQALSQRLTDGVIHRLQEERDLGRRARIYGFPQQFAGLQVVLKEFVDRVFSPSQFEAHPMLRGAYFISGTQEGTPIDRMLGSIARTYRLERNILPPNQASGKSFFLSRLLRDLIFAEADLAGTNLRWERQRQWLAWGGYAVIGLLVTLSLTAWTVSYLNNRAYVQHAAEQVEAVKQLVQATPNRVSSDLVVLLPALQATRDLSRSAREGEAPWTMGFGLYQGRKLDTATRQVYERMLVDAVLPRLAYRAEEQLRQVTDNPELHYEALKAYVMMNNPDRFDAAGLKLYILADWETSLARSLTQEQRQALEQHLDALLALGPAVSPLPQDKDLVAQTRARLLATPLAQRVYNRLKRQGVGADAPPFTIARAAGSNAALVFTRASGAPLTQGVPGLFTFDGYHKSFQAQVERTTRQLAEEESWVLGVDSPSPASALRDPAGVARLSDEVRRIYLNDYVRVWETFIADIRLLPTGNLQQAVQMARILSASDTPLVPLLRGIVRETTLIAPEERGVVSQAEEAARGTIQQSREQLLRLLGSRPAAGAAQPGARIESIVDDRFAGLRQLVGAPGAAPGAAPIDNTVGLINEVYTLLSATEAAVRSGSAPPPSETPNRVRAEAARLPEPVRSLLNTLSVSGTSAALGATRQNLSQAVRTGVGDFCRQAITGRYPFDRNSTRDVTQDDFARLFAPNGLFDQFFQRHLVNFVDTSTRPWRFRELAGASMGADAGTLAQFQRAAAIRDTYFRSGGTTPGLRLDFKPVEMDASITQFVLDVDGQLVRYSHGPQIPTSVQWPGPRGSTQVRVQLQPALTGGGSSGMVAEGPWALFRLFDRVQMVQAGAPERFRVTFDIDGRKATFEVTASSVVNPFRLRDLSEFSCPGSL